MLSNFLEHFVLLLVPNVSVSTTAQGPVSKNGAGARLFDGTALDGRPTKMHRYEVGASHALPQVHNSMLQLWGVGIPRLKIIESTLLLCQHVNPLL